MTKRETAARLLHTNTELNERVNKLSRELAESHDILRRQTKALKELAEAHDRLDASNAKLSEELLEAKQLTRKLSAVVAGIAATALMVSELGNT